MASLPVHGAAPAFLRGQNDAEAEWA